MFKAKMDSRILLQTLRPVTALVDEAKVRLEEGGLRVRTVDAAHVGAVSLDLLAEAFSQYESDSLILNLDLQRVENVVETVGVDKQIELWYNEDERKLYLDTGNYEFDLSLIDPDSVRSGRDPRELTPPAEVVLSGDKLKEAINIGSMFSDQVRAGIDTKRNVFYMTAEADTDGMHLTLSEDQLVELDVADAYGTYSLNYLRKMVNAVPSQTDVHLQLGTDFPMSLYYEIAESNGRITYGLAPRVES